MLRLPSRALTPAGPGPGLRMCSGLPPALAAVAVLVLGALTPAQARSARLPRSAPQLAGRGATVRAAARGAQRAAGGATPRPAAGTPHLVVGFSADTPARVASAASLGITSDILYDGPPAPHSALSRALAQAHMRVIDGRLSGELFYWECHRTHTVARPPPGERNWYCATDERPSVDSPAVVLATIKEWLREDAANPLVSGYWVLDDWPQWDGGSGRGLLVRIRQAIDQATPRYPAICGFGGAILKPGQKEGFERATAANYSNAGCSMVGLYNYANTDAKPSNGEALDWSMQTLLREETEDLAKRGWEVASTPLLGIGQGWSGRLGHEYTPGLSPEQMLAEARAFCAHGASSIGWYAWDDSGFRQATMTPNNSPAIRRGIEEGIAACAS